MTAHGRDDAAFYEILVRMIIAIVKYPYILGSFRICDL